MVITEPLVHVQEETCASPPDSGDGRDELLKRQAIYFNQKCVQLIKKKKEIEEELQKASFNVMNLSKSNLNFTQVWIVFFSDSYSQLLKL